MGSGDRQSRPGSRWRRPAPCAGPSPCPGRRSLAGGAARGCGACLRRIRPAWSRLWNPSVGLGRPCRSCARPACRPTSGWRRPWSSRLPNGQGPAVPRFTPGGCGCLPCCRSCRAFCRPWSAAPGAACPAGSKSAAPSSTPRAAGRGSPGRSSHATPTARMMLRRRLPCASSYPRSAPATTASAADTPRLRRAVRPATVGSADRRAAHSPSEYEPRLHRRCRVRRCGRSPWTWSPSVAQARQRWPSGTAHHVVQARSSPAPQPSVVCNLLPSHHPFQCGEMVFPFKLESAQCFTCLPVSAGICTRRRLYVRRRPTRPLGYTGNKSSSAELRSAWAGPSKSSGRQSQMTKRKWLFGVAALALIGIVLLIRGLWTSDGAARSQATAGVVPVEVATAERKAVPVRIESLGNVTPIASVAIKARVDTTIMAVHFRDGAEVKKDDLLFTLDGRAIEAQIAQTEGMVARDRAQLAGAERDVARYTDLVAKSATPVINLDNAKTQADVFRAAIKSDQGLLDNLKVQLSYCTITAPIDGRISAAAVKVGNFVRQADTAAMATINQMAPVYVSFTVPQKVLPEIRQALATETATIEAVVPGEQKRANGQVTMIENTVDPTTGMATIRATMPNEHEVLWPGTLVTAELTLRIEQAVVVPSNSVQVSQTGNFVFVINDAVAKVQPVTVERTVGDLSVIGSGLKGGETVVTDGQLLLSNGTRVNPRNAKAAGS